MNLILIVWLLCEKINGNAILQNKRILSREERFIGAILGASKDGGNLSNRKYNFLNGLI